MPDAWRIDKDTRALTSFNGAGAAKEGGRWNSPGVHVVYASRSLAMAAQEKYVYLPKPVPGALKFIKFAIDFGGAAVERLDFTKLPPDWAASPPSSTTQALGDKWYNSLSTPILALPGAIIPDEENYLLNPAHPAFKSLVISRPTDFVFTDRITRLEDPLE